MPIIIVSETRGEEHACSVGIALYPRDGVDIATLVMKADSAMYKVKRRGRGAFLFHQDEPRAFAAPRRRISRLDRIEDCRSSPRLAELLPEQRGRSLMIKVIGLIEPGRVQRGNAA